MRQKSEPKIVVEEGKKYRFVVSSAEDAAKTIRERLGERARVVSVKQVNGTGLSRFLSSPQLEVIAMIPVEEKQEEVKEVGKGFEEVMKERERVEVEKEKVVKKEEERKDEGKKRDGVLEVEELLVNSGFERSFVEGVKAGVDWGRAKKEGIAYGLAEVVDWLKREYRGVEQRELGERVAFLGLPGSGTTTVLCKQIAEDIFMKKKEGVRIMKMEGEMPNSDDALQVYCQALNVKLLKEGEVEEGGEGSLYIDVPGVIARDKEEWGRMKRKLERMGVGTRVLVVNGAYDVENIKSAYRLGEMMGVTHVVFTHMDEVENVTKLWSFILRGGIPVLFLGNGQNIAGDRLSDCLGYLLGKTFPVYVLS